MNLNAQLLRTYSCKTLIELLEFAAGALAQIGLPHVVLKWSPAAGSKQCMRQNSAIVWHNFSTGFGTNAAEISMLLQDSILVGLEKERSNTLERQTWRLSRDSAYQLCADAPKSFFLTRYQKSFIRDFGEPEWREFFVLPLSRERERVLVLEAKTQGELSAREQDYVRTIFSVFACVYQSLHKPVTVAMTMQPEHGSQSHLSRREVQCLQWLAAGKTFSEAAIILDVSERTLRFHVSNAKQKLGVSTTMQAVVAAALEYGFDPKDPRQSMYHTSRTPVLIDVRKAG